MTLLQKSKKTNENFAFLGKGSTLKGSFVGLDTVEVAGSIEGEIKAKAVYTGMESSVDGSIVADIVRVDGFVKGEIFAKKAFFSINAKVEGKIFYQSIVVEEGAILNGEIAKTKEGNGRK